MLPTLVNSYILAFHPLPTDLSVMSKRLLVYSSTSKQWYTGLPGSYSITPRHVKHLLYNIAHYKAPAKWLSQKNYQKVVLGHNHGDTRLQTATKWSYFGPKFENVRQNFTSAHACATSKFALLNFFFFYFYYYALTKYKTLVGNENILPTGTKNKDK